LENRFDERDLSIEEMNFCLSLFLMRSPSSSPLGHLLSRGEKGYFCGASRRCVRPPDCDPLGLVQPTGFFFASPGVHLSAPCPYRIPLGVGEFIIRAAGIPFQNGMRLCRLCFAAFPALPSVRLRGAGDLGMKSGVFSMQLLEKCFPKTREVVLILQLLS
jgi:hypothetical protein